ncbi:4'-phosphopantetheinyl transferase [Rhodocollybia butyracea]|uniref:4'-phosphopantetheinyl transferase n=1 Tax=Rhodocollybia butyracea TaxID=206335 RepID=A0A9P5Q7A1_9AGAR|nr:4'-phosphopantetheinyl transferase [Rhodocollybia butyracea]
MPIIGIGVDIAQISRVSALLNRRGSDKLAQRILSELELVHWHTSRSNVLSRDALFLGVRWALKEAAYKATYPTFCPSWKDLTYHPLGSREPGSKPMLSYKSCTSLSLNCSVSHDGDYVFATVLAEK